MNNSTHLQGRGASVECQRSSRLLFISVLIPKLMSTSKAFKSFNPICSDYSASPHLELSGARVTPICPELCFPSRAPAASPHPSQEHERRCRALARSEKRDALVCLSKMFPKGDESQAAVRLLVLSLTWHLFGKPAPFVTLQSAGFP